MGGGGRNSDKLEDRAFEVLECEEEKQKDVKGSDKSLRDSQDIIKRIDTCMIRVRPRQSPQRPSEATAPNCHHGREGLHL